MTIRKPEFVDNRDGNTLVEALRQHLDDLDYALVLPVELSIATGYFNPGGFALIAKQLERLPKVRLLLGAEPYVPPRTVKCKPGEQAVDAWWASQLKRALKDNEEGILGDRDLIPFLPSEEKNIQRLLEWLDTDRVEVRRYTKKFLHGKAFIFSTSEGVIAGSSNFTQAGLTSNLELNLGRYDPTPVAQVRKWFDELWEEAEPYDLAELYQARFAEYPPYLIYLRFLWERYSDELEEEEEEVGRIRLTEFQRDGVWRAERQLEKYHGTIIADGVGLGKTFIGGELIRSRVEDLRQRVLLIAPAALRDGTWERFANRFQLHIESVSFEQFADDVQFGGEHPYLKNSIKDYSLVVIDEGHAFRNPDTRRAAALRKFLMGKPPKDVVFMSATPVNNSLWDLYYVIMYFAGHDAAFSQDGIVSLKKRFNKAMEYDPHELSPDILFDLLDVCTVRRTRTFVKKWYKGARIPGPDGVDIPIAFPTPELRTIKYEFEDIMPELFDRLETALAPPEGIKPEITMARYLPDWYKIEEGENRMQQFALSGLIRSGLLKRFESSIYAFHRTLRRLVDAHRAFLATMDKGYVATAEMLSEYDPEVWDSEEFDELVERYDTTEPVSLFKAGQLREDVANDLRVFEELLEMAELVKPEDDPKLEALIEYLAEITEQAEKDAATEADYRDFRKVAIFSTFVDTVDWIETYIREKIENDPRLEVYRGRTVSTSGKGSRLGVTPQEALYGFVPISSEAPEHLAEDRFDILVSTDVLSEGQNLQQARHVINYDLPWNPMRLVQRHGRLDRIGSRHRRVYIGCFFPEKRLDAILELEGRIRYKLAQAAASIGVESEVIPGSDTSEIVFAETREEIERLSKNDPTLLKNAGEDPHAHSGEEYRQQLKNAMDEWGKQIRSLPAAAGSGFSGAQRAGATFCARVGDRVYYRFVPFDGGEIEGDTLRCLAVISCDKDTTLDLPDDIRGKLYEMWERARHDIYEEWMELTDPRNLQEKVRPVFERAIDHLRKYPPSDISQEKIDRAVDSLRAPWQRRIENTLRTLMKEEAHGTAKSLAIIELVDELGLQPLIPPEPLPDIEEDEVDLVCWMVTT